MLRALGFIGSRDVGFKVSGSWGGSSAQWCLYSTVCSPRGASVDSALPASDSGSGHPKL